MQKRGNNYAFIDSQNVNLAIRALGWKLDFKRFRVYLREHYAVSKAFLFIGYIEGNNSLYVALQDAGFICIFKPTLKKFGKKQLAFMNDLENKLSSKKRTP